MASSLEEPSLAASMLYTYNWKAKRDFVCLCESMHEYTIMYVWCVLLLVQVPMASHGKGKTLPLTSLALDGHLNSTVANTLSSFILSLVGKQSFKRE